MRRSELEQSRLRAAEWAGRHGLSSRFEQAADSYLGLLRARVATGFAPDARGPDLDVMTDLVTWTSACDDLFAEVAGDDPELAESVAKTLSGVLGRDAGALDPAMPCTPLVNASAELWERMARPMSDPWRARARRNWRRFLRSLLLEAQVRRTGAMPTLPEYFALRRETMAMYLYLDAAERAGGYEVPDRVLAGERIEELCRLQIEILTCCDDVHVVEREEARGSAHNVVLVLEARYGLHRSGAIETLREWVYQRSQRFLQAASDVLGTGNPLGLDPADHELAERYVLSMMYQLRTAYDWSRATARNASLAHPATAGSANRSHYIAL